MADLKLDRSLQNSVFQSWRLAPSSSLKSRQSLILPGPVVAVKNTAVDYLHTRATALHNHLVQHAGASSNRHFCFLSGDDGSIIVAEANCRVDAPGSASCTLRSFAGALIGTVCSIARSSLCLSSSSVLQAPAAKAHGVGSALDVLLDPSLAVLDMSCLHNSAASVAAASGLPPPGSMLASVGDGSIVLLYAGDSRAAMCVSEAVWPLRPAPPLIGHRPLVLEAAYALATGELSDVGKAAVARILIVG